jgi:hypothetical protein
MGKRHKECIEHKYIGKTDSVTTINKNKPRTIRTCHSVCQKYRLQVQEQKYSSCTYMWIKMAMEVSLS